MPRKLHCGSWSASRMDAIASSVMLRQPFISLIKHQSSAPENLGVFWHGFLQPSGPVVHLRQFTHRPTLKALVIVVWSRAVALERFPRSSWLGVFVIFFEVICAPIYIAAFWTNPAEHHVFADTEHESEAPHVWHVCFSSLHVCFFIDRYMYQCLDSWNGS